MHSGADQQIGPTTTNQATNPLPSHSSPNVAASTTAHTAHQPPIPSSLYSWNPPPLTTPATSTTSRIIHGPPIPSSFSTLTAPPLKTMAATFNVINEDCRGVMHHNKLGFEIKHPAVIQKRTSGSCISATASGLTLEDSPGAISAEVRWDDQDAEVMKEAEYTMTGSINFKGEDIKDFCSIFLVLSEDYEFEKNTLIQLWMARGYIKQGLMELLGDKYFRFLLEGGYLRCSGTNFVTKKDRYKMNISKINDLLQEQEHDRRLYLKWENGFQNNTTNSTEIQHVSLMCSDIDASVFKTLELLSELKTLLFLGNYGHKVRQIPDLLFVSFKRLQALDLSRTHIKKLSSFVGHMIHLRYLDLSWTLLEWLPDVICCLNELQTLKLRGCSKLRGLPGQLKRLTNLRHLDFDVLCQLSTMPRGIGNLVNIRTLSAFLVGAVEGCKIQELKELNSLSGDFCIAMLEHVDNADEAREAALDRKEHLKKLELRWTASQLSRMDKEKNYTILECLRPCSNLEELQIFCYEGCIFPEWISDRTFDQLVSLTFFKCENVSELPPIEQLPLLKHLELVKMNGVRKIIRRGKLEDVVFSRLEKLEIDEMQSLEEWSWVKMNEGDFKSLTELTINNCPKLQEFHVLPCVSSIKHFEIRECPKLESLSATVLPDSLETLIVEDCPQIKRKLSRQGRDDWHKIQHVRNKHICDIDDDDDDDEF